MTKDERERLRGLCREATQGPWDPGMHLDESWRPGKIENHVIRPLHDRADAVLACAARTALPELLDEIDRFAEEVRRLAEEWESSIARCDRDNSYVDDQGRGTLYNCCTRTTQRHADELRALLSRVARGGR